MEKTFLDLFYVLKVVVLESQDNYKITEETYKSVLRLIEKYNPLEDKILEKLQPVEKKVEDFSFEEVGVEEPDYFQGFSTAYTQWDEVITGVGDDCLDALTDAVEQAASVYDTFIIEDGLVKRMGEESPYSSVSEMVERGLASEDAQFYVGLFLKFEK